MSLDELNRVIRLWRTQQGDAADNPYKSLSAHVHPLAIGAVDRAESLSTMRCRELLAYHIDRAQVDAIATTLDAKYPSHSHPILLDEAIAIGLPAERMASEVDALLSRLDALHGETGQKATTDLDETRAHGNEIVDIRETTGVRVFYQLDKDRFYRADERRSISLHDRSGWRRIERVGRRNRCSVLHVE